MDFWRKPQVTPAGAQRQSTAALEP
jgi:hypothetical protein